MLVIEENKSLCAMDNDGEMRSKGSDDPESPGPKDKFKRAGPA
jgi:hypothetical protein